MYVARRRQSISITIDCNSCKAINLSSHKRDTGGHLKCLLFLSDFNQTRIFSKKSTTPPPPNPLHPRAVQNFTKIRPAVAQLLHADRHDDAYSCFRSSANASKNEADFYI